MRLEEHQGQGEAELAQTLSLLLPEKDRSGKTSLPHPRQEEKWNQCSVGIGARNNGRSGTERRGRELRRYIVNTTSVKNANVSPAEACASGVVGERNVYGGVNLGKIWEKTHLVTGTMTKNSGSIKHLNQGRKNM